MGISSVYKSLQEIFPEVDARLLRAVAIEHPKDAHQAVEVVLTDVLPYIFKHSSSSRPQSENEFIQVPSDGDGPAEEDMEQDGSLVRQRVPNPISSEDTGSNATVGANNAAGLTSSGKNSSEHLVLDKVDESPSMTKENCEDLGLSHDANGDQEISMNTGSGKRIGMDNSQEINVEKAANVATSTSVVEDEVFGELYNVNWGEFDIKSAPRFKSRSVSTEPPENNQILSSVEEGIPDATGSGLPDSGSPASDYKNKSYNFNSKEDCSETNVEKAANVATATSVVEDEVFGELYNVNWVEFDINSAPRFKSRSVSTEPLENNQMFSSVEEGTQDAAGSGLPESGSPASDYKNKSYNFDSKEDCSEINVEKAANVATATSVVEDEVFGEIYNVNWVEFDIKSAPRFKSRSVSTEPLENNQMFSSVEEGTQDAAGSGLPESGSPASDYKNKSYSFNSNEDCSESEIVIINENPVVDSHSGQICGVDLEGIIEDARNSKKTLFSAKESVINLMKEVEHQEAAAEQAEEEAEKGISDVLVKVEEIKRMLVHAKEANDMHAGEVYGEKAILATEARELQIRLLSLSDERDASLAILNEMREALESRLASAEEAIRATSLENQEKEESARTALAEQEAFMEKVVQESKTLQEEAEENSRLQEFLMDRGRVVDTLQGEISVICQDVRLLKERFDKRLPLSHSFTSSQTTSILASSSSSLKSVASDLEIDQDLSKTPMKTSPAPSVINGELQKGLRSEDGGEIDHEAARLDDGWDFLFDDVKSIEYQNILEG